PDEVLPWLHRVVRNGALQAHRSEQRRRRREGQAGMAEVWFAAVDEQLDSRQAFALLAELPLEQREVIVARLWGGLTFEAIAAWTGSSLATAQRRYHAGLARLKERLEGRWTTNHPQPMT